MGKLLRNRPTADLDSMGRLLRITPKLGFTEAKHGHDIKTKKEEKEIPRKNQKNRLV